MNVPLKPSAVSGRDRAITRATHELLGLREGLMKAEAAMRTTIRRAHPAQRDRARNLVHSLELRRHDIRKVQLTLAELGLSSLGRAEAHVLAAIDAVLGALHHLRGGHWSPPRGVYPLAFAEGGARLIHHTEALFGTGPKVRRTRIMVTMPSAAAEPYPFRRSYHETHELHENQRNTAG